MRAHPGREWLVVLSGTAILMLGHRRFRLDTNQAAEFPTMMPHAIGTEGGPCEILGIFDRDARAATSATTATATRALPCDARFAACVEAGSCASGSTPGHRLAQTGISSATDA